jgi:mRNA interferase MazF
MAAKEGQPRRGEIYLTALGPSLIIQNDVANRVSGLTIVAPITSTVRFPLSPAGVLVEASATAGLSTISVILLNQIRTVDRLRLLRRLGKVDAETMRQVDEAIQISLGLIPL